MLEDDIRVLIYAGDVDFICNWIGNKAWTIDLPWSGHESFSSMMDYTWTYGGDVAETCICLVPAAGRYYK
jgi:carboxypeptidase C (cathepsin A)